MQYRPLEASSECPYLDRGDARCEARFRVGQLDDFFQICCGQYRRCTTYHRIRVESDPVRPQRGASQSVVLTAHGQRLEQRRAGRLLPLLP